jgi:hypothetical protein
MCHEYEFDWYEQARIAEKQRREQQKSGEQEKAPSRAPAGEPRKNVKDKEPTPA